MKICPNCKASVIDTAKFCHKCRFNIKKYEEEQENTALYCTECGAELQPDASFCTECGADVVKENTEIIADSFNLEGISALSTLANEQMYAQNGLVVENGVLTGYTGKKRSITIYGSIEEIYDSAFEGNQIISRVKIEEGVKIIGRKSFASCPSLIEISLPASCGMIYSDTFASTSIQFLIMPKYNEKLVKACLSELAIKYFDTVEKDAFVTERDGEVSVNLGYLEENAQKIKKAEAEKEAERKRKAEAEKEAEILRKKKEEEQIKYSKYNPGTVHTFGVYNYGNGPRALEWTVLERRDNKALLVTSYIIDRQKFNENSESTCWERSTIRKWLNENFYNTAFSAQEKSRILTTSVRNAPNPQHGTSSGPDTYDKMFLLSTDEVNKYFKISKETKCQVTVYAKTNGAYCDGAYFGYWWLRTSGQYEQNASYVFYSGGVSEMGYDVSGIIFGVRPAMWIEIK